jgi:predicted RNase H-like nuclease (RuvC/YqgF family)
MDEEDINKRVKEAEWKGYTVRAMSDLNDEVERLEKCIKELDIKIDKINESISNLRVKVAGISAVSALITSIVVYIVLPHL